MPFLTSRSYSIYFRKSRLKTGGFIPAIARVAIAEKEGVPASHVCILRLYLTPFLYQVQGHGQYILVGVLVHRAAHIKQAGGAIFQLLVYGFRILIQVYKFDGVAMHYRIGMGFKILRLLYI